MVWIADQKAFDSVPHSWIIKSLDLVGINNKIRNKTMSCWKTSMHLYVEEKRIEPEDAGTQCGIFQADLLLPLLFFIGLIPFTEQLNKLNTGCD
jgi:hypothetical protein